MPGLLLSGARLTGRAGRWDVTVRDGRIAAIDPAGGGAAAAGSGRRVLPLDGRLLVPGFHDPHVHVLAAARERAGLTLPPRADGWDALAARLARHAATLAPGAWLVARRFDPATTTGGWIPDRAALDRICPDRPMRLRHRNLRLDVLNGAGLERVGLASGGARADAGGGGAGGGDPGARRAGGPGAVGSGAGGASGGATGVRVGPDGVERDAAGTPTGRLHQLGPWLRERIAPAAPGELRADVAAWSRALLAAGVTSVQDAGEHNGPAQLALLDELAREGAVRQRLWTMASGRRLLEERWDPRAQLAPAAAARVVHAKLAPVEARLDLDTLCAAAVAARDVGLALAVHATSEAELAAAVAAIEAAAAPAAGRGAHATGPIGHRIEHACVASDALVAAVAATGAAVVANPALVREAGDGYRRAFPPADHGTLHRLASWRRAGVPLAIASDAPVTAAGPLAMLDAAVRRRTASGAALGPQEALSLDDALAAATAAGAALVGRRDLGRIAAGGVADLVALGAGDVAPPDPLAAAGAVELTVLGGAIVHAAGALADAAREAACGSG